MSFSDALKHYRFRLVAVIFLLVALYSKIVPYMVEQWSKDQNYSHGFLVPVIAGYFVYVRWNELRDTPACFSSAGLAVIVFGLCQLLAGWLGVEYFTMRSSLIVLLAGLLLCFFGFAVLRVVTLPLAYLFFMVPIPYIIYDSVAFPLKLFVTRFSVAVLKIGGVSVMREGNIIMFPATTLEVADACSGIRSLLSLLALAVAYAFYLRITPWRRAFLIGAAIPIAVATNALRVIVTGFLAQHWGARAAQGFFHEFAGLAVFGMAMVLLVSLGALLGKVKSPDGDADAPQTGEAPEDGIPEPGMPAAAAVSEKAIEASPQSRMSVLSFSIICVLMLATGLYINLHKDIKVPMNKPFDQFPETRSGWRKSAEFGLSEDIQKVLKASDVLSRQYLSPEGKPVYLYIGYHAGGKGGGEIHSPKQCLPGSGWFEMSTRRTIMELQGEKVNLVQAVYRKGDTRDLFIYWFQVQDRTINDEYSLKLAEIINSMVHRRRDASFIRISVPFESDEQAALALGQRFVRDFYPVIREFLPR